LTDGAVGNTQQVIDFIKGSKGSQRLHAFGIGSGVSSELIRGCAEAGEGNAEFIYTPSQIEGTVINAMQKNVVPY